LPGKKARGASMLKSATKARGPDHMQIDGGWNIAIYDEEKHVLIAEIVSTPSTPTLTIKPANGAPYSPNDDPPASTELWWIDDSQLSYLTGTISIDSTQIPATTPY